MLRNRSLRLYSHRRRKAKTHSRKYNSRKLWWRIWKMDKRNLSHAYYQV